MLQRTHLPVLLGAAAAVALPISTLGRNSVNWKLAGIGAGLAVAGATIAYTELLNAIRGHQLVNDQAVQVAFARGYAAR